jgi:D-lyxose ketol-isomerase
VWNATANEELADTDVTLSLDGVHRTIKAGGDIRLAPGESICLPQRLYHRFWGEKGMGTVLVGEVSRVNDDHVDNHFFDAVGRFPDIEEDEPPLYLLYNDYRTYYRYA